jgi:prepilin-type N-terminal cleavage/methylation domain-containing protein
MTHPKSLRANLGSGFTLIELLIVIAIIAILAVVVVLTLNPGQLILQARDSTRVSDVASLQDAIGLYITDAAVNGTVSLGSANTVYVSIPDPTATTTLGDQCQGLGLLSLPSPYAYHCAASSTFRMNDSTGWIPINFKGMSQGGVLGQLPQDPVNSSSSRTYETYTTDGTHYEVTAALESQKYKLGGTNDVVGTDGGTLATVYEKGTKLGLEPLDYGDPSLVGLWTFDEGTGSTAYDQSGNGNNGSWSGITNQWIAGKVGAFALSFSGTPAMSISGIGSLPMTLSAWHQRNDAVENADWRDVLAASGNYHYLIFQSGTDVAGIFNAGFYSFGYTEPNDGQWHLYTVVYNSASSQTLYVDGNYVSTISSGLNPTTYPIVYVGGWGGGYNVASLDDVRIYSRALSASEIQAMYNGGK